MPKRAVCLLLLVALWPMASACGGEEVVATERLFEMTALFPSIPAGVVYDSAATVYDPAEALDSELVAVLYARDDGYCEYESAVSHGAVYLGGTRGAYLELAVFVCYGSADTAAVFEMCLRRARLVASFGLLEESDAMLASSGRVVYFCLSSDPATAKAALAPFF